MSLTSAQARNIALAAQGFSRARPARVGPRHLTGVLGRLGLVQIDSVNVLERAHYMPVYSRLGPYDRELLDRASMSAPRALTEYWAHEASLIDLSLWPALRFRMQERQGMWSMTARIAEQRPELLDRVMCEISRRGALTARQILDDAPRQHTHWGWNRSDVKRALEYQFHAGQLAVAYRTAAFERVYDLPERVLPASVLRAPIPDRLEAHRTLIEHAARAHGIATLTCLADYFRLPSADARSAVTTLVDDGTLVQTRVAGWDRTAYLHHRAATNPRVWARALLSPFDPLVFERARTQNLFGFRYRIEIYVPRHKRQYGYYVLPFLLGNRLVARVDLKADRAGGKLIVHSAWAEPGAGSKMAGELAAELQLLSTWLELDDIAVARHGDLADALARAIA